MPFIAAVRRAAGHRPVIRHRSSMPGTVLPTIRWGGPGVSGGRIGLCVRLLRAEDAIRRGVRAQPANNETARLVGALRNEIGSKSTVQRRTREASGMAQCVELRKQPRGEVVDLVDGMCVARAHQGGGPAPISDAAVTKVAWVDGG